MNKPEKVCCSMMQYQLDSYFRDADSVDSIIEYVSKFDEYGIPIRDGGASYILIEYCPWCAQKLPESKRDKWFEELEKQGIDSPLTDEVPEEYRTGKWYRTREAK